MSRPEHEFHQVTVQTQLSLMPQASLEWNRRIELSVDDPIEQRVDRTVHLSENPDLSTNRSSQANYSGFIIRFENSWKTTAFGEQRLYTSTYQCKLPFARFTDTKEQLESSKEVHWARVRFRIQCHLCSAKTDFSSQTNEVVPRELRCACGAVVALEDRVNPVVKSV